jgi:hypothetical protein
VAAGTVPGVDHFWCRRRAAAGQGDDELYW